MTSGIDDDKTTHLIYSAKQPPTSQPLWISLTAAVMLGPIANLCRVTCICACQEMEAYDTGSAGIVGNVFNTSSVPLTTIFAYLYFDDVMSPMEFIGSTLICLAILIVTGGKAIRHVYDRKLDEGNGIREKGVIVETLEKERDSLLGK